MIDDPGWLAWIGDATVHTVGLRLEVRDVTGAHVVDLEPTGVGVSLDSDVAEQWQASAVVPGSEWVVRDPTDPLSPLAGHTLTVWWRGLVDVDSATWVEVPLATGHPEDPVTDVDDAGCALTSLEIRDVLAQARRQNYGGAVIAVGGLTVPAALAAVLAVAAPSLSVRIDQGSTVTLPETHELGGRDLAEDLVDIAALGGMVVRTDREGAVLITAPPTPGLLRADWQEGPSCAVVSTGRALATSSMVNSVTVTSTSTEVDPPVTVTVEDTDSASPTWVGGPWGRRGLTVRSGLVASVEAATNLAATVLAGRRRPVESVTVRVPQRPDLSMGDLVHLRLASAGIGGLYRIAGWKFRAGQADDAPALMDVTLADRVIWS